MRFRVSLVLAALLFAAGAMGLGIAPGDVELKPGESSAFFIVNNENKDMDVILYAQGPLADRLMLSTNLVRLKSTDDTGQVTVTAAAELKPGRHLIELVAMEVPEAGAGETVIAARQAVISKVTILVPYPGKYAEAELVIPKKGEHEQLDFVVKVRNVGGEAITAQARIDVFSPTNDLLASLMTDQKEVSAGGMREIVARYQNGLPVGKYYARATVSYGGQEIVLEETFEVGSMVVSIQGIFVRQFRLGQIAKFDILVESSWNEPIAGIFADMEIRDRYGKQLTRFKTAEKNLPAMGKDVLEAYWDTGNAEAGTYSAKVTLHFLGNNVEKAITLQVREDGIDIDLMPTMRAVETAPSARDSYIVVLVALSILVNIALFIIFARRKR